MASLSPDEFFQSCEDSFQARHGDVMASRKYVAIGKRRKPSDIVTVCCVCGKETGKGRYCNKCSQTRAKTFRSCVVCGDKEQRCAFYGQENKDYYCRKPECRRAYFRMKNNRKREAA